MQIAILILQIIAVVICIWLQRITKANVRKTEELKEKIDALYQKNFGKGIYVVVKQWYDTHDCTAQFVHADSIIAAYYECDPSDNEEACIVNVFKIR